MLFKDEKGAEWEPFENEYKDGKPYLVIRPVKAEPKWEVDKPIWFDDKAGIHITVECTEDQAQLIKEAVEALMKYIMGEEFHRDFHEEAVDKARHSIKGGL